MNFKPIFRYAAAIAAVAAAAAVCVVAASFALYAVAREYIGPAGGAAAVAVAFALLALIVAWLTTRKVTPRPKKGAKSDDNSLIDRLMQASTAPGASYMHQWRAGDVVMWDNRATLHRGRPWPDNLHPRHMMRTTISAGDRSNSLSRSRRLAVLPREPSAPM